MLELLKKWAELEPEKVQLQQFDVYTKYYRIIGNDRGWNVGHHSHDFPAIEYAVRDAIEARSAGYMVETLSLGTYLAVVRRSGDTYDHSASSPAESILAAYVAFLESEVQG